MVTCVSLMSDKGRFLLLTGTRSMASSVESCPSITLPKMVYFESRCDCLAYAMKNWDLLVSGPEFAIAMTPRALNFRVDRISSGKGLPQIDWPPFPVPVGSPV